MLYGFAGVVLFASAIVVGGMRRRRTVMTRQQDHPCNEGIEFQRMRDLPQHRTGVSV
jgi:hypothetical protein